MNFITRMSLLFVFASLSSCTALFPLDPNTQSVYASFSPPPKGCHYLEQVIRDEINLDNWSDDKQLDQESLRDLIKQGPMTDLKTRTAAAGGNYVWLKTHCVTSRGIFHDCRGFENTPYTAVYKVNIGNAYACPARVMKYLPK